MENFISCFCFNIYMKKRYLFLVLVLLLVSGCEEVKFSPEEIPYGINIDVKDTFYEGEKIRFDYSILLEENVTLEYIAHVECPNAPVALLNYQDIDIEAGKPIIEEYKDFEIGELIEPQTCVAYVEVLEPEYQRVERLFRIEAEPSMPKIGIDLCKDESCLGNSKIFVQGGELYLDFDSSVENSKREVSVETPGGETKKFDSSLTLGETGVYSLYVNIKKQGYKDFFDEINFAVIDKVPNIREKEFVANPKSSGNEKNMEQYSEKELFLVSSENWRDVLGLVPVTTWTEGGEVIKYPSLIYHHENLGEEFVEIDLEFSPEGEHRLGYTPPFDLGVKVSSHPPGYMRGYIFREESCLSGDLEGILPVRTIEINPSIIYPGEVVEIKFFFSNCNNAPSTLEYVTLWNWPISDLLSLEENTVYLDQELQPGEQVEVAFYLTFDGDAVETIDLDSTIHFIQQYDPSVVSVVGDASEDLFDLLVADPPFGSGLSEDQIQLIDSDDYFLYWNNFDEIVVVDLDNYEASLMASVFASYLDTPIIFVDETNLNKYEEILEGKGIYVVGSISGSVSNFIDIHATLEREFTLEELQAEYVSLTNTDKIVLLNPNDLDIIIYESFYPDRGSNPMNKLYNGNSLAAPFLASAKHEVIFSTENTYYQDVDQFIDSKIQDIEISPEYLTIVASPNAIEMSYPYEVYPNGDVKYYSADEWYYSEINDGDPYLDLATGRIFGLTVSDSSSNIARSLFYEETLVNTEDLLVTRGSPYITTAAEVYVMGKVLETIGYNATITPEGTEAADWEDKFFISYNDHGSSNWAGIPFSEIPYLDDSFITLMACSTCDFDEAWAKRDLFCANSIRKGAIGIIGATDTSGYINNIGLLNEIFGQESSIGGAFKNAKNSILFLRQNPLVPYNYMPWYTLLGDPTLEVRTEYVFPKPELEVINQEEDNVELNLTVQAMRFEVPGWVVDLCDNPGQVGPMYFTTAFNHALYIDYIFAIDFLIDGVGTEWMSEDEWFVLNEKDSNFSDIYWVITPNKYGDGFFEEADEEGFEDFSFYINLSAPSAFLTGEYNDYGLDEDGDELYDYLILEVEVFVNEPGEYAIDGGLSLVGEDYWHHSNFEEFVYLDEGIHFLNLSFDGSDIYGSQVDGDYELEYLYLYNSIFGEFKTINHGFLPHNTDYYFYEDFERPDIMLTGEFFDYGIDEDSDGLYDYLAINVDVRVFREGNYRADGRLHTEEGTHMHDYFYGFTYLNEGYSNLTLLVEGVEIYENGEDGPYWLGSIGLRNWSGYYFYNGNFLDYQTNYYSYLDFENLACVVPVDGMVITEDVTFCPGTYSLPYGGIRVEASNIELICDNTILDGEDIRNNMGIDIQGRNDVLVQGCEFKDYDWGAYIVNSEDINLVGNRFNNVLFGVEVYNSQEIGMSRNTFINSDKGVSLTNCMVVAFDNNIISSSQIGIDCMPANQNIIDLGGNLCEVENCDEFECIPFCQETDGGVDEYNYGEVDFYGEIYEDYCISGTQDLVEYYCDGAGDGNSVEIHCLYGCSLGECQSKPEEELPTIQEALQPQKSSELSFWQRILSFFKK